MGDLEQRVARALCLSQTGIECDMVCLTCRKAARAIIPMVLERAAKQVEALPAAEIYCGVKSVWLRDALAVIRAIGAP